LRRRLCTGIVRAHPSVRQALVRGYDGDRRARTTRPPLIALFKSLGVLLIAVGLGALQLLDPTSRRARRLDYRHCHQFGSPLVQHLLAHAGACRRATGGPGSGAFLYAALFATEARASGGLRWRVPDCRGHGVVRADRALRSPSALYSAAVEPGVEHRCGRLLAYRLRRPQMGINEVQASLIECESLDRSL